MDNPTPQQQIDRINSQIQELLTRMSSSEPIRLFNVSEMNEARRVLDSLQSQFVNTEETAENLLDTLKQVSTEITGQNSTTKDTNKAFRQLKDDLNKLKYDQKGISQLSEQELKNIQKRAQINKDVLLSSLQENKNKAKIVDSLNKAIQKEKTIAEVKYKDSLKEAKTQEDRLKVEQEYSSTLDEISDYSQNRIDNYKSLSLAEKELLKFLYDQKGGLEGINRLIESRVLLEQKIAKAAQPFGLIKNIIQSIPVLSAFSKPFEVAEERVREVFNNTKDLQEARKAGADVLKASMMDMFKSPLAQFSLLLKLFKAVLNIAFQVDKQVNEIGKAQALSATEARNFRAELWWAARNADNVAITTKSLLQSQGELSKSAGVTRGFKDEELEIQTNLTKRVGIQAESAAKLADLSRISNMNAEDAVDSIIKQTVALQRQTGVQLDNRDIIEEVAQTNGQIAATLGNNPPKIAAAVVEVRKLGLTLQQARDISKSLLDFESSIGNELEAELLTGKSLNLERARALALQGRYAEAAAEVASQVGSLAEFTQMNVVAQESLAKAAGMTVDQFSDSLAYQQNLVKLGAETSKQVEERIKYLNEQKRFDEASRLQSAAANEEDAKAALMRLDAQERFNLAVEKAKDLFSGLANYLPVIIGALVTIGAVMAYIAYSALMVSLALTGGGSAIGILAGAAALGIAAGGLATGLGPDAGSAGSNMTSSKYTQVKDGAMSSSEGLKFKGQKDSIQILQEDQAVIAGTDLFSNNTRISDIVKANNNNSTQVQASAAVESNRQLMSKIDRLIEVSQNKGNIYLEREKIGVVGDNLALMENKLS